MKYWLVAFLTLGICMAMSTASFVFAQTPATQPVQNSDVMGPGDSVTIVAPESEELSKAWRVTSSGDLSLPMVGTVHAAGLTTDQLAQELTLRLKAYVKEAQVSVYISEYRSQPVTVAGAVHNPGRLQTEGPKTLLTVLMMAGGVNLPGPTVTVTRDMKYGQIPLPQTIVDPQQKYSSAELRLKNVLDASSSEANLILRPNDVVSVSTNRQLVYIIGEVNRPGVVELVSQDSISVMQVLAAAGGLTKVASAHNTQIMRVDSKGLYDKTASIDLNGVLNGKIKDRALIGGDIVMVPSSRLKTYTQAAALSMAQTATYVLMRF
jgi:polysaccharide export outer membrane protein